MKEDPLLDCLIDRQLLQLWGLKRDTFIISHILDMKEHEVANRLAKLLDSMRSAA